MKTSIPVFKQQILILIDTISIQKKYTEPSLDLCNPIQIDLSNRFLICSRNLNPMFEISLNGISLQAEIGDRIIFTGISIDGGSFDSIILYKIETLQSVKEENKVKVFGKFNPECFERSVVQNKVGVDNEFSTYLMNQNFILFKSCINKFSNQDVKISFAVYIIDNDGQQQSLYGYFCFIQNFIINKVN
ncbi:MAG: AidA/PixA family protein [Flavobacterium sp.]|uniref:AidA/PixA family protein n=1 Tax=Flavobacterium sp. TaxID=239 RepID=UPI003262DA9F